MSYAGASITSALSTFAGTSNVTTLGTITTGVWTGTAIAVAKGGTGAGDASGARSSLGLGSLATQSGTFSGTSSGTNTGDAGTVTSVSIVTANGVSGSVANPTTTPAVTLTLAAITPTTIVASGTITTAGDLYASDSAKGLVLKDTQGSPHYWRISVTTLGVLATTDLGTTPPT